MDNGIIKKQIVLWARKRSVKYSMEKKKIKEIIVVEGKHDTQRLQRFFDCDTIETSGLGLNEDILERIETAAKARGIIIFTDPDSPGEQIRKAIAARIPQAKHVFIEKAKAKTDKKVGVEHASKEDLASALEHAVSFMETAPSITRSEFLDLSLVGNAARREYVCRALHIGRCNAKTCFKRLNAMGIGANQIKAILEGYEDADRNS